MNDPILHAFFVGRALAEVCYERAEHTLTDAMSELGKLDAELREQLRQFTEEVLERASGQEQSAQQTRSASTGGFGVMTQPADLQATIDDLRAEIARLRSELKRYRSQTT